MAFTAEQLKSLLVGPGHIAEAAFNEAADFAANTKQSLTDILLDKGLIADSQLGEVLANYLEVPFTILARAAIPSDILGIIPEVVAKKQQIIAFEKDKTGLKVATSDPTNKEALAFIAKKGGDPLVVYYATPRDIAEALRRYEKDIQKTFNELLGEQVTAVGKGSTYEVPIARLVELLMEYAYTNKASDIHIEPRTKDSLVRFRIDGVLHDILPIPKKLHEQIVTRIKVLAKLRTDEHLSAQDGKLQFKIEHEDLDVRVSLVPIVAGEKVVMRLLSSHARQLFLPDLGLDPDDLAKVQNAFKKPYGMVLSTGPTGCGKTSTIYAIVTILNTRDKNIASIEDPVEYEIEGVNQIQVNAKTNLTFAAGLRSILRQDPNVIFVGEIRDKETASIAVNSAMTGHLVLSTLHTNNAATALPRLIDMDIEPFLIASTVNVIIAQRLVRTICSKCRESAAVTPRDLSKSLPAALVKKYFGAKKQIRLYQGKGCAACHNSGYQGRVGIFEVLEVSDTIRKLIVAKSDADIIKKQAIKEGMTTMLEAGLKKVSLGITTIEEILRATE